MDNNGAGLRKPMAIRKCKLCSIVRETGIRKGERLGKNVPLVFRYIPVWLEYHAEYTATMIQSVFVPTV